MRKTLKTRILNQNCPKANPLGENFNYKEVFENTNLEDVKKEIKKLMTESKEWWPADFGHYGPLFLRLAWHSAGTYRIKDGRRGANRGIIRFFPVYDWPDNVSLDKALKLLWPIKRKFGTKISWSDLIILAGNVALEDMEFNVSGFAGGRVDAFEFEEDIYWESEQKIMAEEKRLKDEKPDGLPAAASLMGLIYVNPEGPKGVPDPIEAAKEIRASFKLMGMNDEETVALIAGGHSFGKCHGAAPVTSIGPSPDESSLEEAGLGWRKHSGEGKGADTVTSGFEVTWVSTPTKFSMGFLNNLFKYEYVLAKSPAGLHQWVAKDAPENVPDAHDPNKKHKPTMLTTDLALKFDSEYKKIALSFFENPQKFEKAFAQAWFKLTHRDLGSLSRYIWKEEVQETFAWQDPLPKQEGKTINSNDIKLLKKDILNTDISIKELVYTAWSSASSYRDSDKRGGANGARIRLAPQKDWEVNHPESLKKILDTLFNIKENFNNDSERKVSLADIIVLGGCAAIEKAAAKAGFDVKVPFTPGRVDAAQEQMDTELYEYLEPEADGFRNYLKAKDYMFLPEELFIDKAQLLRLSALEMVVLTGGLKVLGAVYGYSDLGVLTDRPETLSNEYFVNLLDTDIEWQKADEDEFLYSGVDRRNGKQKWKTTRFDLILAADSQLRVISEVYAFDDCKEKFVNDFVNAWVKVMNLDRFDVNWR